RGHPQTRPELARALAQATGRLVEADAVVLAGVRVVVDDPVHPLSREGAGPGEHAEVDGRALDSEIGEQRVDGRARVSRVVLQSREPLLGGAADDRAVTQHRGRRAVGLVDAEDDHASTIVSGLPRRYDLPRAETMARQNAGRSLGLREVMRLPSTTTSASCQSAPAATRSSLMEKNEVALRPSRTPAETSIQ